MASDASPLPSPPPSLLFPPATQFVRSADWDRDAPDLELARPRDTGGADQPESSEDATPTEMSVGMRTTLAIAGVTLVAALGFSALSFFGGQRPDDAAAGAAGAAMSESESDSESESAPALAYRGHVVESAVAHGIEAPTVDELLEPNAFSHPVSPGDVRVLAPSRPTQLGDLQFEVRVERRSLRHKRGMTSKSQHTSLLVTSEADRPLAYRLTTRPADSAECSLPVVFGYDALVIEPGETFEISVCSGRHAVEVIDLRTLEVSELGAAWIRQLPPEYLGLDAVTVRAHEPGPKVLRCEDEGTHAIADALEDETARWEDVIDFYSRHDCHAYAWSPTYRRSTAPLSPKTLFEH